MVEVTDSGEDAGPTAASSNFSKHSQNSLTKGEPKVDPGEAKVTFGDRDGQCWVVQRIPRTFSKLAGGNGKFRSCTEEATH